MSCLSSDFPNVRIKLQIYILLKVKQGVYNLGVQTFGQQTIWAIDVWVTRCLGNSHLGDMTGRQDVWEKFWATNM